VRSTSGKSMHSATQPRSLKIPRRPEWHRQVCHTIAYGSAELAVAWLQDVSECQTVYRHVNTYAKAVEVDSFVGRQVFAGVPVGLWAVVYGAVKEAADGVSGCQDQRISQVGSVSSHSLSFS